MKTIKEIISIMCEHQEELNSKYSPDGWRKIGRHFYACAASKEFSEFLDEVTILWKWWQPEEVLCFNKDKAVEEFIDTLMFVMSFNLHEHRLWEMLAFSSDDFQYVGSDEVGDTFSFHNINYAIAYCLNPNNGSIKSYFGIEMLIKCGMATLDISTDQLLEAYTQKRHKNMARIESGYLETGDKKGLE